MTETAIQDDRALLNRAQAGDISAFEELVGRHQDRVYGLALRMTRSEPDAAEIAQDTFLSAYQHLPEFRGEAAFGSWVHRIAANNALMRLRHQRVLEVVTEDPAEPEFTERGSLAEYPETDWSRRADDKILDDELGRAIREATDSLAEGYREVFLLKDVEGMSYEEISEMLGISVPAVKSRLHRARLALRQAIDDFYKEV
jgi:RNA polymerase sigma-70 factor, ECF subfamily